MKLGTRPRRHSKLGSEVRSVDWLLPWDSVSWSKVDPRLILAAVGYWKGGRMGEIRVDRGLLR